MQGQDAMLELHAASSSLRNAAPLPDAPSPSPDNGAPVPMPQSEASAETPSAPKQTKRILGIVPNFRSVSADQELPSETVKEKFKTGLQDSFDYSSFLFIGVQAGASQVTKSYPAFHQGAAGFGRYYWHTFADQADENLWVESILPAALHEDSRYYTLGHGGLLKRAGYAMTRVVIARTDSGGETFNAAEIVGAGAASGLSSAYYPSQYCTWTKTGQRWLSSVVLDGATFVAKEFWPNINSAIFHQKN
jgi:hypothetical protein